MGFKYLITFTKISYGIIRVQQILVVLRWTFSNLKRFFQPVTYFVVVDCAFHVWTTFPPPKKKCTFMLVRCIIMIKVRMILWLILHRRCFPELKCVLMSYLCINIANFHLTFLPFFIILKPYSSVESVLNYFRLIEYKSRIVCTNNNVQLFIVTPHKKYICNSI